MFIFEKPRMFICQTSAGLFQHNSLAREWFLDSSDVVRIVFVSCIESSKGLSTLLRAIEILKKDSMEDAGLRAHLLQSV